jgi:TrmH family RNA methyltransferase
MPPMQHYGQKFIHSLENKKTREKQGLFVVEGAKSVLELVRSDFEIVELYTTKEILAKNKELLLSLGKRLIILGQGEIQKLGLLEFNNTALALAKTKEFGEITVDKDEKILALDSIRDPGNLGTIIRTADWFGIKKIVCSNDTADFYNSKAIAASMGSFTRVEIFYTDLELFLAHSKIPVIGATMKGKNAHEFKFPKNGILVMGNESNGITQEIMSTLKEKVTIPRRGLAESLNVGIATGILLDLWNNN